MLVLQVDPRCARDADPVPLLGVLLTDEHLPTHDHAGEVGLMDGAVHSVRTHAHLVGAEACGVHLRFFLFFLADLQQQQLSPRDGRPTPR